MNNNYLNKFYELGYTHSELEQLLEKINKPYYLIVIKYDNTNIYQELIGGNSKKYRRFTGTWSEWVSAYSNENPVTARDVTGIHQISEDKYMEVAILNDGTFVTTELKVNPVTNTLVG